MNSQLNVALIRKLWVIGVFGLFVDMLSMGDRTTWHWQTFGRPVQELNDCTVCIDEEHKMIKVN